MYWTDATDHFTLDELIAHATTEARAAAVVQEQMRARALAGETGFDPLTRARLFRDRR